MSRGQGSVLSRGQELVRKREVDRVCTKAVHMILQGNTKLSPVTLLSDGILFLVQKDRMSKKIFIATRNLKECLPPTDDGDLTISGNLRVRY